MKAIRILNVLFVTVISVGMLFIPAEAKANTVVIDFDSAAPGGILTDDYFEDGFKIQLLSGHYDIWPNGGTNDTSYLGLDKIDPVDSEVRLTSVEGELFNLISLVTIQLSSMGGITVTSSAGGGISLETSGVQLFTGPEWKNLSWVRFSSSVPIGGPGLDTITLSAVPIPAAGWLLGSGLIVLAGYRPKAQRRKPI